MSESYKIHEDGLDFVTFSVIGWLDVFTRRVFQLLLCVTVLSSCKSQFKTNTKLYSSDICDEVSVKSIVLNRIKQEFPKTKTKELVFYIENREIDSCYFVSCKPKASEDDIITGFIAIINKRDCKFKVFSKTR